MNQEPPPLNSNCIALLWRQESPSDPTNQVCRHPKDSLYIARRRVYKRPETTQRSHDPETHITCIAVRIYCQIVYEAVLYEIPRKAASASRSASSRPPRA